jgi:tetratricopeptide (TPR) repeat protein
MRRLIILLIVLFGVSLSVAAENQAIWKEAADHYDRGEYRAAINNYNMLAERGLNSSRLYYNLGNSYFKANQLGYAIWSYRRALLLDPGFKQAKSNLQYIRTFNTDQVDLRGRGFILDIWDFFSGLLSTSGYLLLLMLGWWALAALVVYKIVWPSSKSWAYYLLIVPAVIIIFSSASAARRISEDRLTHWGVLAIDSADIREGPGIEFNRVEVGHEGLEFKILGNRENSFLIELGNGLKGWVDKQAVLEI